MRLTTLLRSVLRSDGEFTTLGRERELIEAYLDIERERFEERLEVRLDIPRELDDLPIPALILQPLVENAVKHGITPSREGGSVTVAAVLDGSVPQLRIVVQNTGASLRPLATGTESSGVGLHNVHARLSAHYGAAAGLKLTMHESGATVAELIIPLDAGGEMAPTTGEDRRRAG
jgi:sensor histidine kinase YesM